MQSSEVAGWQPSYARLAAEWAALGAAAPGTAVHDVADWDRRLAELAGEVAGLRAAGLWRSGSRTLLATLGLQYDELRLTAALAWLLRPDGHHGLGDGLLRRLCALVGSEPTDFDPVTVDLEEVRADTRADLVVRLPGAVLLVEAKVRAGEQPRQCARLAELWDHEDPTLVFLTPRRRPPTTAEESHDRWHTVSWGDLAELTRAATAEAEEPAPGVLDVVATWEGTV
ncbi:PD-(D/E)XK nuclease family protein [Blastococcus sp. TF02A-26]|uniref:PD-(D/E)XK nuclease family protein n=1 Tax=Blastococcus sp. TF02A-26 TaxID=2250577 RepID=UPI0013150304|nr:PD-(D/E)XK nuclease family protein [Blastococcus sp. TF02A-26]